MAEPRDPVRLHYLLAEARDAYETGDRQRARKLVDDVADGIPTRSPLGRRLSALREAFTRPPDSIRAGRDAARAYHEAVDALLDQ